MRGVAKELTKEDEVSCTRRSQCRVLFKVTSDGVGVGTGQYLHLGLGETAQCPVILCFRALLCSVLLFFLQV